MLQNYGQRLVRLAEETESAMRELRDLRRGRVLIGANEAAVHTLLPLMARFRQRVPDIAIDVRRVPARQIAVEVQQGSLDFGALTFRPPETGLLEVVVGSDELVLLVPPSHPLAKRRQVSMEDVAGEPVVAHNDPSPARERVLRLFEERHIALNMVIALPSLDGIKRAVELKLGVALLPRRCAMTEIASGRLVAVPVAGLSRRRQVMLVCRKAHRSHAANAFLAVAQEKVASRNRSGALEAGDVRRGVSAHRRAPRSKRSSSIAVGFHWPLTKASRNAGGIVAAMRTIAGGDDASVHACVDERVGRALDERLQRVDGGVIRRKARNAQHRRIPLEDLGERLADDRGDPEARQALRRVLARRAAAEVPVHDEDRRALVSGIVERVRGVGRAVVFEQVLLEPFEGHGAQEPRRHDPIGVEVVAAERQAPTGDRGNGRHEVCSRRYAGTSSSISRTSTTSPAIAAAATIAGLMSSVRPVGLP